MAGALKTVSWRSWRILLVPSSSLWFPVFGNTSERRNKELMALKLKRWEIKRWKEGSFASAFGEGGVKS